MNLIHFRRGKSREAESWHKKLPISFEALERRDTPSQLVWGVHAAAKPPHPPLSLAGSGTATVIQENDLPKGGLHTVSNITGNASVLSQFSGQLDSTLARGLRSVSASAELKASNGDLLDLSVAEKTVQSGPNARFTGSFTVLGGTGRFTHATGSGKISGIFHQATNSATFQFNGKIRV